ncbi:MAG: hypothetical protein K5857_06620 [Lachnospiraceae bacterium]|nr:hypothetical protein [Lachnospiraceae bacterium]
MIYKLSKTLQLQYDGMLIKLYDDFVSKEVYELSGDLLTALGRPFSIEINLKDGSVEKIRPFEEWNLPDIDSIQEVNDGSLTASVLKYILMQVRIYKDIQPVANDHMRAVRAGKLNDSLKFYDIVTSASGCAGFVHEGRPIDAESLIKKVADESIISNIMGDADIDLAKRLMGLMRYKESLDIFLPLLERTREGSMFNTELNFYIGEIYYHMDKLEESLAYYRACNTLYIYDMRDYHIRLGHCLMDDKAGLRASLIKMYYRCYLNPTYKKSISEKYEMLREQVEPIYAEYEEKCEEAGRNLITG